jgi:SAM-dependent methyltransferase
MTPKAADGPGSDTMRLCVHGHWLDLSVANGVRPTAFSMFLANLLEARATDKLAIDAGAGSGILAITLARLGLPKVLAVERSEIACELLDANIRRNGVASAVEVVQADIAEFDPPAPVDLVVCNPPTIPERGAVPEFVSGSGGDGMAFLRLLAGACSRWLIGDARLQMVLSSIIGWESFARMPEAGRLLPTACGTLICPFRAFYWNAYNEEEIEAFAQAGRVRLERQGDSVHPSEEITMYTCVLRSS